MVMVSRGDDPTEVAREVERSLRALMRCLAQQSRALVDEVGLTVQQLSCLETIEELGQEHATVAVIASAMSISPPNVSRMLDRMEEHGLVVRERDREDRRRVFIRLTERGRTIRESEPDPLQKHVLDRLLELPTRRRRRLLDALKVMASILDPEVVNINLNATSIFTGEHPVVRDARLSGSHEAVEAARASIGVSAAIAAGSSEDDDSSDRAAE